MLNIIIIVVAVLLGGYLAFSRRLAGSSSWQATTPAEIKTASVPWGHSSPILFQSPGATSRKALSL